MIAPEQCQTMSEVRAGVDAVDEQIVALLSTRFRFMDAAARIKPTRDKVRDEERKAAVLDHVRSSAAAAGAPAEVIAGVDDTLVEASIAYELDRFDRR